MNKNAEPARCRLPLEAQYSDDYCQIVMDMDSAQVRDYLELATRYPCADGIRDISICQAGEPTDLEGLSDALRAARIDTAIIGWLIFHPTFVSAAEYAGKTPKEYADLIYDRCEQLNAQLGYRAALIEIYGEIGNSICWPSDRKFTKKEALEYYRRWFRSGRSLSTAWERLSPPEVETFYSHGKRRGKGSFKNLPVYYTEDVFFAIHEAFNEGFPMVMYETQALTRNATQTGIAFARGGARMHDAFWGMDLSPWNYESPQGNVTEVNALGYWKAGLTPEHFQRLWITAYMSGSNMILHEMSHAFFYTMSDRVETIPTEYGFKAMQFYALTKGVLSKRGKPCAPIAVMLQEEHGYRGDNLREYAPDGSLLNHGSGRCLDGSPDERLHIWKGKVDKVTPGDWQIHRLVQHIWPYPDNESKGLFAQFPDEPIAHAAADLQPDMRLGWKDPREYDKYLRDTRFADAFDFITQCAGGERLKKFYKAIVLAGDIRADGELWDKLKDYISCGGIVAACVNHLGKAARSDLGLEEDDKHIIIKKDVGLGTMYVCMIPYGLNAGNQIAGAFAELLGQVYRETVGVWLTAQGCQMLVNDREQDTLVTLLNHTGRPWHGAVHLEHAGRPDIRQVKDIVSDQCYTDAHIQRSSDSTEVHVSVPAYGFRIISLGGMTPPLRKNMVDTTAFGKEETEILLQKIRATDPEKLLGRVDNK